MLIKHQQLQVNNVKARDNRIIIVHNILESIKKEDKGKKLKNIMWC